MMPFEGDFYKYPVIEGKECEQRAVTFGYSVCFTSQGIVIINIDQLNQIMFCMNNILLHT